MGGLDTQDEWQYIQQGHTSLPGTGLDYPGSLTGGDPIVEPPTSIEGKDPLLPPGFGVTPGENYLNPDWGGLVEPPGIPEKPSDELPQGYVWQYINGEWIPNYVGVGGGSLDIPNYLQESPGLPEDPYSKTTYGLEDFTGGGGLGGQLARRLYYPGTSGGFAGVGSGIGGGNTLQELLKQYQG